MNLPSCTTPSRKPARFPRARTGAAAALLAAGILCACGGGRPDPERPRRAAEDMSASPDPAKGQGVVTFRYSNKSTDANLQVDLGATDISLEMTGRPAESAREAAAPAAGLGAAGARKTGPSAPADPAPEAAAAAQEDETRPERKSGRKPKAPERPRPDTEAAEEELGASDETVPQDVTDKVLLGIRKAQEFFYQKRYPEALQMARSSLDARPTAEGHALAGSIHYMMGATGLARRHWQQALRLNPDMPAVVNMLEKIATPGGRGSPHPRPLAARRNTAAPSPSVLEAASPLSEPPFPDEIAEPVAPPRPAAQPGPAAPTDPAPDSPAPAAPKPAVPASPSAPASSAVPAPASAEEVAAAPSPQPAAPAVADPGRAAPATAPANDAAAPASKAAAPAPVKPRFPRKEVAPPGSGRTPADAKEDKSP